MSSSDREGDDSFRSAITTSSSTVPLPSCSSSPSSSNLGYGVIPANAGDESQQQENHSLPLEPETEYYDLDLTFDDLDNLDLDPDLDADDIYNVTEGGEGFEQRTQESIKEPHLPRMDGSMPPKKMYNSSHFMDYILGTLIVRVVAARDLKPVERGGLGKVLQAFGSAGSRKSATINRDQRNQSRSRRSQSHYSNSFSRRRLFERGVANPYSKITFGNQTQRTTQIYETVDPVWPREEQSYFDVSLPVPRLAHEIDAEDNVTRKIEVKNTSKKLDRREEKLIADNYDQNEIMRQVPPPPRPILIIEIMHTDEPINYSYMKDDQSKTTNTSSPFQEKIRKTTDYDEFLGIAHLDITPILTGKTPYIDQWLTLEAKDAIVSDNDDDEFDVGGDTISGQVRIICEYEPTDPPPRPGDLVRFTGFVDTPDIFPLPPSNIFRVDEVINSSLSNNNEGDEVILSYITSPENWTCTFAAHRFMLICAKRHQTAVERYQEELLDIADRLSYSPMVGKVTEIVGKLPEDGLLYVGFKAARGGTGLMGRWFQGGLGTAVSDIIYATNWDGQHTPDAEEQENLNAIDDEDEDYKSKENESFSSRRDENPRDEFGIGEGLEVFDVQNNPPSGMPSCPITGQPMLNPVVAADGHTYERSALLRWLNISDMSPLTGAILPHKELVPNYALLSTFTDRKMEK